MCQKFTNFKIAIKNLVGGRLAWALSHGASEEKTLLEKNLLKLYLSGKSGWVFFQALLLLSKDTFNLCLLSLSLGIRLSLAVGVGGCFVRDKAVK